MGWRELLRSVFRILFVLINNLYCIPTYVIWSVVLHPVYYWNPDLYWKIESQFFQWLLTMVAYWSYSAGYYIVETGDAIENIISEETLVLINHQSTSDVPLLMHCFCAKTKLLENLNWIMDAVFQYTNFGIVSTLHGDFFINAGRDRRDASLKDLEDFLKLKFLPRKRKWLVLFPEGGFLRKRKEASKRYAAKMNLPNLDYVTLPRLGALQTIINTLAPAEMNSVSTGNGRVQCRKLKYIVDMTIAYPNGEPLDLGSVITGSVPPCQIRMHYKIYPINEVPHDDPERMQTWLYNMYIEKNNMLGHYYRTGEWNPKSGKVDINKVLCEDKAFFNRASTMKSSDSEDVVDEARRIPSSRFYIRDSSKLSSKAVLSNLIDPNVGDYDQELLEDKEFAKKNRNSVGMEEPLLDEEGNVLTTLDKNLHLDLLRIFIIHCMFIASTLFHITAFYRIYTYACELYFQ